MVLFAPPPLVYVVTLDRFHSYLICLPVRLFGGSWRSRCMSFRVSIALMYSMYITYSLQGCTASLGENSLLKRAYTVVYTYLSQPFSWSRSGLGSGVLRTFR